MSSLTLALLLSFSQSVTGSAPQPVPPTSQAPPVTASAPQPVPPTPEATPVTSSAAPETTSVQPASPASSRYPVPRSKSSSRKTTAQPATPPPVVSGPISLAVSTQKKILVVRVGGVDVKQYAVAVGTNKKPTPMGHFTIRHIVWNPAWHPPAEKWAKGKKPAAPGDPKNPMKVVKVFFQEPDYYIHGTADEDSLGSAASHGCIRMASDDVYSLARYLQDHAGAAKDESWYNSAISGSSPQSVNLPKGIPIVIGK